MRTINANANDYMVTPGAQDGAGATTFWRLAGEIDDWEALAAALAARGIMHSPTPAEPEVALHRAVKNLKGPRRLVRPLRKGAWAVIDEELDAGADRLKHWDGPTIVMTSVGRPAFKNATPEEQKLVGQAYAHYLDALTTEDISSWLTSQVKRLNAVALRSGGGIYYLPPAVMPEWRKITEALKEAAPGHTVHSMPTIQMTTDGAKAILDCLSEEIEERVAKVSEKVISGALGVRALENRADETKALLAKVVQYEGIMGERLDALRAHLANLQTDLVAATLAAEAVATEGE